MNGMDIVVIRESDSRVWVRKTGTKKTVRIRYVACRCHCRKEFETRLCLVSKIRSCGCIKNYPGSKSGRPKKAIHELSRFIKLKNPTYRTWLAMRTRCNNPNNKDYPNYGGRGITCCPEWKSFDRFLEDMGDRPHGTTIDRINNEGPYSKSNCRWASRSTQQRNKRTTVKYEVLGKFATVAEICSEFGFNKQLVYKRLNSGWDVTKAFTLPPFKHFDRWSMPSNKIT